jgi:plastocyanin
MKSLLITILLVASSIGATRAGAQSVPAAGGDSNFAIGACAAKDFVIGTAQQVITIVGRSYSPRCVRVPVGATVTIQGSGIHPLQGSIATSSAVNPFATVNGSDAPVTRVLSQAGVLGYFCTHHGDAHGQGMAGVIVVQ